MFTLRRFYLEVLYSQLKGMLRSRQNEYWDILFYFCCGIYSLMLELISFTIASQLLNRKGEVILQVQIYDNFRVLRRLKHFIALLSEAYFLQLSSLVTYSSRPAELIFNILLSSRFRVIGQLFHKFWISLGMSLCIHIAQQTNNWLPRILFVTGVVLFAAQKRYS